jgi:hypothetical protein
MKKFGSSFKWHSELFESRPLFKSIRKGAFDALRSWKLRQQCLTTIAYDAKVANAPASSNTPWFFIPMAQQILCALFTPTANN